MLVYNCLVTDLANVRMGPIYLEVTLDILVCMNCPSRQGHIATNMIWVHPLKTRSGEGKFNYICNWANCVIIHQLTHYHADVELTL